MEQTGLISATALVLAASLSGCASGFSLDEFAADKGIITESVSGPAEPADAGTVSDEITIRNAVSSAYLEEISDGTIPWANLDTGSRGEIREITEYREKDLLCRKFVASRESFEGVSLYQGDACMRKSGSWWMRYFSRS